MHISRLFGKTALAIGALGTESIVPAGDQTITPTGSNIEVVVGNEPGISAITNLVSRDDIPPHGCNDILGRDTTPQIDCFYSWENCGFDNHLEYHIRINAIDKTSPKWCDMMFHNVQRSINYNIRLESCDRGYQAEENGNGMEVVLTLPRPIPKFGDWRLNVEQGIRDSLCKGSPELNCWVNKRHRWTKQSLKPELLGDIPEPTLFNYGNSIMATTVSTEPVAATMINHAAAKLAVGTADNVDNHLIEKRLASAAKCPPPPGEDRSCDSVDKHKISSIAVHCSYVWDQDRHHNLLNYKVVINPTGQNTRCWCKQFLAAVRNRCPSGEIEWAYPVFKCNHRHIRNTLGYGMYINFYNNIWVVGEDNHGCIKAAIEDTTCGVPLQLERGGC